MITAVLQSETGSEIETEVQEPAALTVRFESPRLQREWKTLTAMIRSYCRHKHSKRGLCPDCQDLLQYAATRLERCRFRPEKPTCAKCPVHCYQPSRREQIKAVMRFAGPRMLWEHPLLALQHWLDSRSAPVVSRP